MAISDDTKKSLVNPALRRLGHPGLDSLTVPPTDAVEKLVVNDLESIVVEVLEYVPWVCVTKRDSSLTADSTHVNDEYTYGWDLPSDFVRLVGQPLYNGCSAKFDMFAKQPWRQVGTKLETQFSGPDILYVYYEAEDTYYAKFDKPLTETIRAKMAERWSYLVTDDPSMIDKTIRMFQNQLREARAINARKMRRTIHESRGLLFARLR